MQEDNESHRLKELTRIAWLTKNVSSNSALNLIFSSFHRILHNLSISPILAKCLVCSNMLQLISMMMHEDNEQLASNVPASLLYFLRFPTFYQYLSRFDFIYTMVAAVPVGLVFAAAVYYILKVYRTQESRLGNITAMKNRLGLLLYLLETVLVLWCYIGYTILRALLQALYLHAPRS